MRDRPVAKGVVIATIATVIAGGCSAAHTVDEVPLTGSPTDRPVCSELTKISNQYLALSGPGPQDALDLADQLRPLAMQLHAPAVYGRWMTVLDLGTRLVGAPEMATQALRQLPEALSEAMRGCEALE
jgi:hypothetical protein